MNIATAIQNVTGVELDEADLQGYLKSVVLAINELDEDQWNTLPTAVQEWFNEAGKIFQENQEADLPEIPGLIQAAKAVAEKAEPKKRGPKPGSTRAPRAKAEGEEEKAPKERKPRIPQADVDSAGNKVRKILIENAHFKMADLIKELEAQNIPMKHSSAQVIYNGTTAAFAAILKYGKVINNGKVIIQAVTE